MTLPASGAISMSQMAHEVGLSLPISINHPWFLLLIGKSGFPISFSDFYGKTGRFDGSVLANSGAIQLGGAPLFGGTLGSAFSGGTGASANIIFNTVPQWTGNLKLTNNTTGASLVMTWLGPSIPNQWGGSPVPANFIRNGFTDNFTITPSN
jgi:hypothetical protein